MPKTFKIGDRVKYDPPQPELHACTSGEVVYYRGLHDPRNPRVRWSSGWGTTVPADELGHLSELEAHHLPRITLIDMDTL